MIEILRDVPLGPRTTLKLGGEADFFATAKSEDDVREAHEFALKKGISMHVLGGGSNLVVADSGVRGLVVAMAIEGVAINERESRTIVDVGAGEEWDVLVARLVHEGLAGLECLSGIPGLVGATPIQNVGAYGVQVSDVLESVRVFDRKNGEILTLDQAECELSYRDSMLRRADGRFVVLSVRFTLRRGLPAAPKYAELARALPEGSSLQETRDTVIALRRAKSMVIDEADPNWRSVGSFFVNPIVPRDVFERVLARFPKVPHFHESEGRVKIPAAWLIENAGIAKGTRRGHVGISSRHTLALVHHGGGTTAEIIELAREVRDAVQKVFEIELSPEPIFLGFENRPF